MAVKIYEVREFDIICKNQTFENADDYIYLPEKEFDTLAKLICGFVGEDRNASMLDFLHIGYKRNVGEIISIRNYVGVIQIQNDVQLEILPKIELGDECDNSVKTKRIFLKMLRNLKDFTGKASKEASLNVTKMSLYEVFISMYLADVRKLVKHGLKSDYIQKQDNLTYFKGKLQINQHIKSNMAHKERFYVLFDEFQPNRPENRIIKSTLLKLQNLTTSTENSKEIKQLLIAFEMVAPSWNHEKDFSRLKVDRNTKDYESLLQWSKVFLLNKGFTTFTGKNHAWALLFPMERIYESYVAQQVKKMMPNDWEVSIQTGEKYLFKEENRIRFSLRPDIVLRHLNRTIILDTKWKRLINDENRNYGISQADMYQMYAYSKKYCDSEIWLLYPMSAEMKNHSQVTFNSGDGTVVNVFFVEFSDDAEPLKESLMELIEKMGSN